MIIAYIPFLYFQDHVLIFSFILCVGVLRERGEIQDDVWNFFLSLQDLTGGVKNADADSLKLKQEPTGDNFHIHRFTQIKDNFFHI